MAWHPITEVYSIWSNSGDGVYGVLKHIESVQIAALLDIFVKKTYS